MRLKFGYKEQFTFIVSIVILTNLAILLDIPFLRQTIGFLFLTILPGVLILQNLKLNKLNTIETILYSLGLSITFVMFIGFFMNVLYPPLGFSKPISTLPLSITISIFILILSAINYLTNKHFSISVSIDIKKTNKLFSPSVLLLTLLPVMSILGMCMFNFYGNNLVLLILIILISAVVALASFEIIPDKHYPLAIFAIAIALVFYGSLITFYIVGDSRDLATEFYYYDLVMLNSYWDSTIYGNVNAMLSISILPVIFSKLLNISGEWVFRIIYPLIFAFVPLTLYQAYQKQTDAKSAFLSIFFFMAMPVFFNMVPILARMCIAELFFALLILLIIEKNISRVKSVLLSIIFAMSLIVSHYGISYFYMFYLLVFILALFIVEKIHTNNFWEVLRKPIKKYWVPVDELIKSRQSDNRTITRRFVLIYIIFALSWYMYMSSSSAFNDIVHILDHVYDSIFTDLLNPAAREDSIHVALGGGSAAVSLWHIINRYIWHITELFIIVGVLSLILKRRELKFGYEYVVLSIISSILLAMCLVLPFFSTYFSMERIYHITLFFLAPCCVIGGQNIFRFVSKQLKKVYTPRGKIKNSRVTLTSFLLIIILPYFLFNSGFIFTFTDDLPPFSPLSAERYKTSNDTDLKVTYLYYCIPTEDFISAKWLSNHKNDKSIIYTGFTSKKYLLTPYPLPPTRYILMLDRPYLFSWDNVPGNDSKKLLRYLHDDHDIIWAESAEIRKSDDGKTLHIFEDENSIEMVIDDMGEKVTLKISDVRTHNLKIKKEKGRLNICDPPNQRIESDTFVYLRHFNIEDGKIIMFRTIEQEKPYSYSYYDTTDFFQIYEKSKIYSNGAEIYR